MSEYKPEVNFCAIHNVEEPYIGGENAPWCFECNHQYESLEDVIALFNEIMGNLKPPLKDWKPITSIEEALFCPLCLHDW